MQPECLPHAALNKINNIISTVIGAYNQEKQGRDVWQMLMPYTEILFVYFLTLPSLLYPSILLFFILLQESNRILSWVGDHYHVMNEHADMLTAFFC